MIFAFLAGVTTELAWLCWLYCTAQGWPWRAAAGSMAIGAFSFLGVRTALVGTPSAVCLVLGYGTGSYAAAWAKRRWGMR